MEKVLSDVKRDKKFGIKGKEINDCSRLTTAHYIAHNNCLAISLGGRTADFKLQFCLGIFRNLEFCLGIFF